jgi:Tol biopolymer transport system component
MRRLAIPVALLAAILVVAPAAAASTTRVSVRSNGTEGNSGSYLPSISSISRSGRYVAFASAASNLVAGDTNGFHDVFVRDRSTGKTSRVSVDSNGKQGKSFSDYPSISADGRYVAFESEASNLVAGDTNGTRDVFVRDRSTGKTTRVSVKSNGKQGKGLSSYPTISADGRYVAFTSEASNLVAGDTNDREDIFVHDRVTKKTTRVSVRSSGTEGNDHSEGASISADGRYIAFVSLSSNLVAGDTNDQVDTFVHDRVTKKTTRVNVKSDGKQGEQGSINYPSISADGRYVAFMYRGEDLVAGDTKGFTDIFVRDRVAKETTRVSVKSDGTEGNGDSVSPAISAAGRYVAFISLSSNLVAGDTNDSSDVFVHDRVTGKTRRVSVTSEGAEANGDSISPAISADGRVVAFDSYAPDLVADDTNDTLDVFVRVR